MPAIHSDFTNLVVVLATISIASWVVVVVTVFLRFLARLRYRRLHFKNSRSKEVAG